MRFLLTAKEGPFSRNPGLLALTRLRISHIDSHIDRRTEAIVDTDAEKRSFSEFEQSERKWEFAGKRQSRKLIKEIKFPETRRD